MGGYKMNNINSEIKVHSKLNVQWIISAPLSIADLQVQCIRLSNARYVCSSYSTEVIKMNISSS